MNGMRDFEAVFGAAPSVPAEAPGRVNLLGEHTDYNDGYVLPTAIPQRTRVALKPVAGERFTLYAAELDQAAEFTLRQPPEEPFALYVYGCLRQLVALGVQPPALQVHVASEVPMGVGLSSSAALEVAVLRALRELLQLQDLDDVRIAQLAQRAEIEDAGVNCGIMDQFICALGRAGDALLLDCRSQQYQHLPLPHTAVLFVMDTQVKHSIGGSEYPVRQQQCRDGLDQIRRGHSDLQALRDISPALLAQHAAQMDPLTLRRCRHVVTEITRTLEAADALRSGDLAGFGRLMNESHASLRDDYEVSCDELDAIVDAARKLDGVYGARMTGGGFGGCAIMLVEAKQAKSIEQAVAENFAAKFGRRCPIFSTHAAAGANVIA